MLLLGVAVVAWLVAHANMAELLGVISRIGWGFVAILLARAATIVVDCAAWQVLLPRRERPRFASMLPLRWIGESINTTLPAGAGGGGGGPGRVLRQRVAAPARGAPPGAGGFFFVPFAPSPFSS